MAPALLSGAMVPGLQNHRWRHAPATLCALALLSLLGCNRTTARALDAAALEAMRHAWLEACDRRDRAGVASKLEPAFVEIEDGRFYDGPFILYRIDGLTARHAPLRGRTWREAHTYLQPAAAVFIGESTEHIPADGEHPAAELEALNTLVWVPDGGQWKLASWQWQRGGLDAERARWNGIYRASVDFKLAPNQLLVDSVKGRTPGTALDLAMGQGRNSLYLASLGWKVTGIDISDEALRIARQDAAKQALTIDALEADMSAWDFGSARWDLIAMIYAGNELDVLDKLKRGLRQGGLVVIEGFHKDSTATSGIGGFRSGELAAVFRPGFRVVRDEVVEDQADWGQRKTKLVRFVAQKM